MFKNLNDDNVQRQNYGSISSSSVEVPAVSFSPTEFMSLRDDIGHNMVIVNSSVKKLEKIAKNFSAARSANRIAHESLHSIYAATNLRIEAISKDLMRLTQVVRRGDKQQKLQVEKLTNDFRNIVERFSTLQKQIASAMKNMQRRSMETITELESQGDQEHWVQDQIQINEKLRHEQTLLMEQQQQIKQIEADMLDVNAIMRTISSLIQDQAPSIDLIESNIEHTAENVEEGREQLLKASNHRTAYRKRMLILLAIAVIIGIIVTVVLVLKLSG